MDRDAKFAASALRAHGQAGNLGAKIHRQEIAMRAIVTLAVAFAALSVAACNTIAGMGQDTAAVGHAVTNTANDAK
jgi:predicted small secreted protein